MPIIIDNTVLSNLAAVGHLDLLRILDADLFVASAVYEEVQQGLAEGYDFLTCVDEALDHKLFSLTTLETEAELQKYRSIPASLDRGEAMSLAIADVRGWRLLTDDRAARAFASQSKIPLSGTLGLLIYAIRGDHLTLEQANKLLADMIGCARYRTPVRDLSILL